MTTTTSANSAQALPSDGYRGAVVEASPYKIFTIIFLIFDFGIPGPAITTGILRICKRSYISSSGACLRARLLTHPVRKIYNLDVILDS